ncbi:MAG: O-methyltransferase [Acidimicrobiales bacterium]
MRPLEQWSAVDHYISELLVESDEILDAALVASAEAALPPIQVAPNQGKFLQLLARACGARRILEIGTLGGYSTIWLARALPEGGHLVTLERELRHAEVARANLDRAGLSGVVEIRVGPAQASLAELLAQREGPFDFTFIDADRPGVTDYVSMSLELSHPGSVIVVDNVVRGGSVVESDTGDPGVEGVRRLNERMSTEPRVSATEIQTVGVKGYDGFALLLVNG